MTEIRVFTAEQGRIGSILRKAFKNYIKPIDSTAVFRVYKDNFSFGKERYEIKGNFPIEYTFCFNQPFRPWIQFEKAFTYQSLKDLAVDIGEINEDVDINNHELRMDFDRLTGNKIINNNNPLNDEEEIYFNEVSSNGDDLFQQAITDFVAVHDNLINFLKSNERVKKIIFCSAEDTFLEIKPLVFYEKQVNQEINDLENRMERAYQKCFGRNGVNPYFDYSLKD